MVAKELPRVSTSYPKNTDRAEMVTEFCWAMHGVYAFSRFSRRDVSSAVEHDVDAVFRSKRHGVVL